MNKFYKLTALLTWVLAFTVTGNAFSDGEWLRAGNVWLKGLVYAGTSKIALTNAAGNLATTTASFSGSITAAGVTNTGNSTVAGTFAVTGATTLRDASLTLSSVAAGVTASTTSAQGLVAASGLVTTLATQVSTSGTAGDSLTMPPAAAGLVRVYCNRAASNSIDVFPNASDAVNKEAADAAIALAAGECMICFGFDGVQWGCVIGSAT